MAGCLSKKKRRISKWLFGRIDQDRHLQNGGGTCSAGKGKLAGEGPEQARLQQITPKPLPLNILLVRRARSQLGTSPPLPGLHFAGSLLLDFCAVIVERMSEKADLFLKTSPFFVMSRPQPAGRSRGTKALILPQGEESPRRGIRYCLSCVLWSRGSTLDM